MKPRHWFGLVVLFVPVFLLGCRQTSETPADNLPKNPPKRSQK